MEGIWPDDSIFARFAVFEQIFKTVDTHEIKTAVLIPKDLKPGSHSVIFNLHGGFLVYGHSLFAPFFSPWVLKLALENSAIVVSPDYRLLPSANGVVDVLEDLEDFWQWTHTHLAGIVQDHISGHSIDLSRLLLTGNSAGGYCAIQLALSHPNDISAVAVAYPFLDPKDNTFVKGPTAEDPTILRLPLKDMPSKDIVLASVDEARKTITSKAGLERTEFAVGATQHGLFYSRIFDSSNLNRSDFVPVERIRAGAKLPKNIWIMHGDDDAVVHIRASHRFIDLVRDNLPDTVVRFDIAPGEDHAFDLLKTSWELHAIGALDFVKHSWLEG